MGGGGGRMGGGGGRVGSRRRVKASIRTHSNAVSSVSIRKGLNPQDRSRQSLAAVWYQSHPYWCHPLAPQTLYCTMVV